MVRGHAVLCLFVALRTMLFLCGIQFLSLPILLLPFPLCWFALRHSFPLAFSLCLFVALFPCALFLCAFRHFLSFSISEFPLSLVFVLPWFVVVLFLFCFFVTLFPCALSFVVSLFLWPSLALSSPPGPPWPLTSHRLFPCCSLFVCLCSV